MIPAVSLLLLSLALVAGGCSGSGGKKGATATPRVTATAAATIRPTTTTAPAETPTPAPDIRQQDVSRLSGISQFIASSGGRVAKDLITYVDLTGDGVDEAVVPIGSTGEGANIAVFVYGYGPAGLSELLRVIPESGSVKDNIANGKLTITEPVFAPGDAMCCPSQLRVSTYRWNGEALVVESQRTEQAVQN